MVYDRRRDEERGGGGNSREPVTLERTRSTEARDVVVGPVTIPFVQGNPAPQDPPREEWRQTRRESFPDVGRRRRRRGRGRRVGGWDGEPPTTRRVIEQREGRRGRFAW